MAIAFMDAFTCGMTFATNRSCEVPDQERALVIETETDLSDLPAVLVECLSA